MSALAVEYDPLLDKSYAATRLGSSVVDFLAWKKMGGAAERTLDQYERDLARGCLMYPNTPLEEFSDSQMLHVAGAFHDAERRVRVAAWRSFFKWALRTRRISVNPTDALPEMKQPPQRVIDVFSDAEVAVLEELPLRDGALMQLLFDAGLRKAEARNFRLMHLRVLSERDRRSGVLAHAGPATLSESTPRAEVVVLRGKGGKDRVIGATQILTQRLNELAVVEGLSGKDHLWYSRPGGASRIARDKPIVDSSFDRWWRRCLEEAGVRYRNPHTTRHTFATRWLRRGGRLSTLSDALGHESIATTDDLYGHLDVTDMAVDLALIEEAGRV